MSASVTRPGVHHLSLAVCGLAAFLLVAVQPSARAGEGDEAQGVEIVQFLSGSNVDPHGSAKAQYSAAGDQEQFQVELENVDAGDYEVLVGGIVQGTITVPNDGQGAIAFKAPFANVDNTALDFDVLEQPVQIRRGETLFFSSTFTASGGAGGKAEDDKQTELEVFMVNVGPDFNASVHMQYAAEPGAAELRVTHANLDAGTYVLRVGGQPVAEIVSAGEEETEVAFHDPVDEGKTLLNFDPLGQQVEIVQGETVLLTAFLPASAADTGVKSSVQGEKNAKDVGKGENDALLVLTANTGVVAGAQGEATLEQSPAKTTFVVKVQGLAAGAYTLRVDGIDQGVLDVDSKGEAELEFSDEINGVNPLDFDVKGKLLEVRSAGATVLGVVFPVSVQAALDKLVKEKHKPNHSRLNLLNAGADLDATGLAVRRVKGNSEVLRLKIDDLAAGNYHVLVDGVERGSLTIKKDGGAAKLVFDSAATGEGKKLLLDFVILNTLIEVTDDTGAVVLRVTML